MGIPPLKLILVLTNFAILTFLLVLIIDHLGANHSIKAWALTFHLLCVLWLSIRGIFWLSSMTAVAPWSSANYFFLYWMPTPLEFGAFMMLPLYFAHVLYPNLWKSYWRFLRPIYAVSIAVLISVQAIWILLQILSKRKEIELVGDDEVYIEENLNLELSNSAFRFVQCFCFLLLAVVIAGFGMQLHFIEEHRFQRYFQIANPAVMTAVTWVLVFSFFTRGFYQLLARLGIYILPSVPLMGNKDVSVITFLVFELWDYLPTILLIATITSRSFGLSAPLFCPWKKRSDQLAVKSPSRLRYEERMTASVESSKRQSYGSVDSDSDQSAGIHDQENEEGEDDFDSQLPRRTRPPPLWGTLYAQSNISRFDRQHGKDRRRPHRQTGTNNGHGNGNRQATSSSSRGSSYSSSGVDSFSDNHRPSRATDPTRYIRATIGQPAERCLVPYPNQYGFYQYTSVPTMMHDSFDDVSGGENSLLQPSYIPGGYDSMTAAAAAYGIDDSRGPHYFDRPHPHPTFVLRGTVPSAGNSGGYMASSMMSSHSSRSSESRGGLHGSTGGDRGPAELRSVAGAGKEHGTPLEGSLGLVAYFKQHQRYRADSIGSDLSAEPLADAAVAVPRAPIAHRVPLAHGLRGTPLVSPTNPQSGPEESASRNSSNVMHTEDSKGHNDNAHHAQVSDGLQGQSFETLNKVHLSNSSSNGTSKAKSDAANQRDHVGLELKKDSAAVDNVKTRKHSDQYQQEKQIHSRQDSMGGSRSDRNSSDYKLLMNPHYARVNFDMSDASRADGVHLRASSSAVTGRSRSSVGIQSHHNTAAPPILIVQPVQPLPLRPMPTELRIVQSPSAYYWPPPPQITTYSAMGGHPPVVVATDHARVGDSHPDHVHSGRRELEMSHIYQQQGQGGTNDDRNFYYLSPQNQQRHQLQRHHYNGNQQGDAHEPARVQWLPGTVSTGNGGSSIDEHSPVQHQGSQTIQDIPNSCGSDAPIFMEQRQNAAMEAARHRGGAHK